MMAEGRWGNSVKVIAQENIIGRDFAAFETFVHAYGEEATWRSRYKNVMHL